MIASGRRRSLGASIRLYIVLGIYLLVVTFPFYYMVLTSLRTQKDVYNRQHMLTPSNLTFENYATVLNNTGIRTWLTNSTIVAFASTTIAVLISVLAAYSLARLKFFGSQSLAKSVLFMYLVPSSLLFIPLFLIISNLRLLNTLWALIISYQTFNVPFCTWLLLGYFRSLPEELEDAARIDGCAPLQLFWRIMLPLGISGAIVVAIFAFVPIWGEYLFSFTFTSTTNAMPMSVGIRFFEPTPATGQYTFNVATAAALVMFLPSMLVYLLLQRWFTKGMMEGALKF
jgi:multiple sugar transport system permease protein